MLSTSFSLRMSSNRSMPAGANAPRNTMSLKAACSPASSRRRSGVVDRPSVWQREHSSMNLISPALMAAAVTVCAGGFANGSLARAGGVGGHLAAAKFESDDAVGVLIGHRGAARRNGPFRDGSAAIADLNRDILF